MSRATIRATIEKIRAERRRKKFINKKLDALTNRELLKAAALDRRTK